MFIPTIETIQGKKPFRNIAQLVNRAGRGAAPIGAIYTPQHFIEDIQGGVNASIADFDKKDGSESPILAIDIKTPTMKTFLLTLQSVGKPIGREFQQTISHIYNKMF